LGFAGSPGGQRQHEYGQRGADSQNLRMMRKLPDGQDQQQGGQEACSGYIPQLDVFSLVERDRQEDCDE